MTPPTDYADKIYTGFEQALSLCAGGEGYSNGDLIDTIIKKNMLYRKTHSVMKYGVNELTTLIGISAAHTDQNELTVIDHGGGGGSNYVVAREFVNKRTKINWTVIETPAMCAAAKPLETEELRFHTNLDSIPKQDTLHLILSSSSLQYCPSPINELEKLLSMGADYFFLTRTPMHAGKTPLVSIQRSRLADNGPGPLPIGIKDSEILYPITYLPEKDVIARIENQYAVKFKAIGTAGSLHLAGEPVNAQWSLLAKKK